MISRFAYIALASAGMIALAAPAEAGDPAALLNGTNVGTVGGAVVGGVAGHVIGKKTKLGDTGKMVATIGGTIVGGYLGNVLGQRLDAASRQRAYAAHHQAVSTGTTRTWNGETGSNAQGQVRTGHPYKTATGICRDYEHVVRINGRTETVRGIACRNPDGSWRDQG